MRRSEAIPDDNQEEGTQCIRRLLQGHEGGTNGGYEDQVWLNSQTQSFRSFMSGDLAHLIMQTPRDVIPIDTLIAMRESAKIK